VKDKGPGGHILTGPIFVEGAKPGDTLEVRILKIEYAIPYSQGSFRPTSGVSAPPGTRAGNLDNKDLVAGTTLFIPVHVAGALFEAGDGHAAQGNGEVDITALETLLVGTFEFVVRKDLHQDLQPRKCVPVSRDSPVPLRPTSSVQSFP
jgi:acetamidase/formamidase